MFDLLLVGMFTAFFIAVVNPIIDILAGMFGKEPAWRAISSLIFSLLGTLLVETYSIREFTIKTVAGAFLGSALLAAITAFTASRPTIINTTRQ